MCVRRILEPDFFWKQVFVERQNTVVLSCCLENDQFEIWENFVSEEMAVHQVANTWFGSSTISEASETKKYQTDNLKKFCEEEFF